MTVADGRSAAPTRVVVVTGMSGAGRTTALHILEDTGYEAIDTLPVSFLGRLLWRGAGNDAKPPAPLAIGVDIRTRDFDAEAFARELAAMARAAGLDAAVVFLDCDSDVLVRRFTETRRRHPLAADRPVADGIRHERELLAPVRAAADLVVDTSQLSVAELRQMLERRFSPETRHRLTLSVVSFAYGRGLPREADLVFDVRFLRNPHYVDALRPGTGQDAEVAAYIEADEGFAPFIDALVQLLRQLLPRTRDEGKSYLTIAVGCTGGRHRSVFVAERLAAALARDGERAFVRHRDLDAALPGGGAGDQDI